jgi:hypothetical protein
MGATKYIHCNRNRRSILLNKRIFVQILIGKKKNILNSFFSFEVIYIFQNLIQNSVFFIVKEEIF